MRLRILSTTLLGLHPQRISFNLTNQIDLCFHHIYNTLQRSLSQQLDNRREEVSQRQHSDWYSVLVRNIDAVLVSFNHLLQHLDVRVGGLGFNVSTIRIPALD